MSRASSPSSGRRYGTQSASRTHRSCGEWDARGYDRVAETMSAWSRAAGAGRALLLERAGITPGQRVLDLCSGPGWLAIEAARAVAPDGHGGEVGAGEGIRTHDPLPGKQGLYRSRCTST